MAAEYIKHSEIESYARLHEMSRSERWHLYRVVLAMDDVLMAHWQKQQKDG